VGIINNDFLFNNLLKIKHYFKKFYFF